MEVHQLATSLTYGDAISDEILEIQRVLREKGFRSEIFTRFCDPRLAGLAHDYREYTKYSSKNNVAIFHFSIGSPVSRLFFRLPDKKIMIYHNITPHEYFIDYHRILARECYKGRLEIKLFIDKVDLVLGDSEFNRKELEAFGYRRTGVLPILINFQKFKTSPDPITKKIYNNGRKTILFVGRLIPNKKYEDIIKVYAFYRRYFEPKSQLILAGDHRGLERYLAALFDLIDRLKLQDIYFTGHLPFPALRACYEVADVFLSMSEHEGFGVPLIEAFIQDVPVIAYKAGAVEETLNGGGILLKEKNYLGIAALIDRIIKDKEFRARIIKGQKQALQKYQPERIGSLLLYYLDQVIKE
ncbi:MAG: glycosyltransferase family 4 protein [Candidatus Aminicenantes bacterium]|nr:glycosyltransferase family 4 protein [Candidatus Aminicenantes bacterium]